MICCVMGCGRELDTGSDMATGRCSLHRWRVGASNEATPNPLQAVLDELNGEIARLRAEACDLKAQIDREQQIVLDVMRERDKARLAVEEVICDACGTGIEGVDSLALRSYADAIRLLATWGRVRITSEYGRRVIAEWVKRNACES